MPFGKYKSFEDCVAKNQDKENPEAYCATIERKIRGEAQVQTGNYNLAVFSEPFHIVEDSHCCLKVNAVIAKEGVYDFPAGPNGENRRCLWSRNELLKAARTARAAKIIILDHPPNKVITSQDEIYGIVENAFYDRDRIRARLNFDKEVCPPDFLETVRVAAAKTGSPKDVSIGFYYEDDVTPGMWRGQPYDLVMRNMVIDHVAAGVWKGRCSWPNCGIGVSSTAMAAFLNSRVQNKGGKKQMSQEENPPESDIPDNVDEHGCKVGEEKWDEEKQECVPVSPENTNPPETVSGGASEGESPTAGPPAEPPPENRGDVDEHGCYEDETWSEEQQMCIPNRTPTEEVEGESPPISEQTENAAAIIERGKELLKYKHDRDVERLRAERRQPA